jgi:hypothetical protein
MKKHVEHESFCNKDTRLKYDMQHNMAVQDILLCHFTSRILAQHQRKSTLVYTIHPNKKSSLY